MGFPRWRANSFGSRQTHFDHGAADPGLRSAGCTVTTSDARSQGAIQSIFHTSKFDAGAPVLQVIDIKRIPSGTTPAAQDRFRRAASRAPPRRVRPSPCVTTGSWYQTARTTSRPCWPHRCYASGAGRRVTDGRCPLVRRRPQLNNLVEENRLTLYCTISLQEFLCNNLGNRK